MLAKKKYYSWGGQLVKRTTEENRTPSEKGDTPSKRGSSLRNYLDQTQSGEFGQKEEGESHPGDDRGAYSCNTFADLEC